MHVKMWLQQHAQQAVLHTFNLWCPFASASQSIEQPEQRVMNQAALLKRLSGHEFSLRFGKCTLSMCMVK